MSRSIIRIELTFAGKKQLQYTAGRKGMTQVALLSSIVEWFALESDGVQDSILNRGASYGPELAAIVLEKIAAKGAPV